MSPAVALPALQHQQACGEWGRRGQNGEGQVSGQPSSVPLSCPLGDLRALGRTRPLLSSCTGGGSHGVHGTLGFWGAHTQHGGWGSQTVRGVQGGGLPGVPTYTGRESAVNPYPLREVSGSPYPTPGGSAGVVLRPGRKGSGGEYPSRGEPSPPR